MRLGIFSDIHANYEALSAALESFRHDDIDEYHCLGDVVGYGGSPNECACIVRDLAVNTILGNHDAAVAGRMDYSYYYEAARNALDEHTRMLSSSNLGWLKSLPYSVRLEFADLDLAEARQRMANPLIVDGRNMLDPATVEAAGFHYEGIGRNSNA